MIYTIIILGPPYGTQNSKTGFLFTKSLIKANHLINKIFFYGNGIFNSNIFFSYKNFLKKHYDVIKSWNKLSEKYSIDLKFCIGSFLKRGLIKNSKLYNKIKFKKQFFLNCKFSSLMDLSKSVLQSDRLIQF